MAYTTLSDLKIFLGIASGDTSEDGLLNLLIAQVSAQIDAYLGRTLSQTTYTEYYLGNGKPFLPLNQRPVVSITSLWQDDLAYWGQVSGAFGSATLLTAGVDYALDVDQPDGSSRSGLVYNINGYWDVQFTYTPGIISCFVGPPVGNIKVTYVAGYASVPVQIELACNLAIARVRNLADYGQAVSNESYEESSYALAAVSAAHVFSPEVRSLLARFRNVSVA